MIKIIIFILSCSFAVKADQFPNDFLFGVATSAYQVEGAWNTSGKGESMWDWYTHTFPYRITDGSNGDVACDSYNKYNEDLALLQDLGVQFYRMSLSWPRILPKGYANEQWINWEGVEYYLTILRLLKESGIEPVVTLYHWDLPQPFNDIGGWTNPDLADYFADYARLCYKLFGEYVKYWVTLNEPQTTCVEGYSVGSHAPGYNLTGVATYWCAYVHLKAHAKAYHIYRDEFFEMQQGRVSIVLASVWLEPNTNSDADVATTEKAMQFVMGLFAHPIYKGNWPQIVIDTVQIRSELGGYARSRLPELTEEEIKFINGTADYFGLNYYTAYKAYFLLNTTDRVNVTGYYQDMGLGITIFSDSVRAASSWLYDVPTAFRKIINWVADEYGNPEIFITENGFSDDGSSLNDTARINYLNGHMCNTLKAINEDNRTIIGYTEWSLMDNFEWGVGYTEKFGIVSVDFDDPNRTRTPKESYYWYKDVVQSRNINCTGY